MEHTCTCMHDIPYSLIPRLQEKNREGEGEEGGWGGRRGGGGRGGRKGGEERKKREVGEGRGREGYVERRGRLEWVGRVGMPSKSFFNPPFWILKVRHPAVIGVYCIVRDSRSACSN